MKEIPFVATQDEESEILRSGRIKFRRAFMPQPQLLTAGGAWLYDGEIFVGDDAMQSHLFHDVYGGGKSPYGGVNGDGTGDRLWVVNHSNGIMMAVANVCIELEDSYWVWVIDATRI